MTAFAGRETARFFIRQRIVKRRPLDKDQIQRLLEYLGGVRTAAGFLFSSSQQRQMAWEVLTERYGRRYFEKYDLVVAPDSA